MLASVMQIEHNIFTITLAYAYVNILIDDSVYTYLPSFHYAGQVPKGKKLSAFIIRVGLLFGAFTVAAAVVFAIYETYPTMKGQVFLRSDEAVIVQQNGFDPFYYTTVTFTKNRSTDNGHVRFYMQPCSDLAANTRDIHTNVTHINQSVDESSRFRIGSYYLVTGSNVLFNVIITAHTELPTCSASLYIFRDYLAYSNFLADGSDTGKARQICLLISNETFMRDHNPSYVFIADETSYYFIGLPFQEEVKVLTIFTIKQRVHSCTTLLVICPWLVV